MRRTSAALTAASLKGAAAAASMGRFAGGAAAATLLLFITASQASSSALHTELKHISYLCTYDLHGPVVMFLMRVRGQVGGGWALEIESFLGLVKWHRAE